MDPPVFITDKPPLVNDMKVYKTSNLLEHIENQEKFNTLLLNYLNKQEQCSRYLFERTKRQEEINNLILKNLEKINKMMPDSLNELKEEIKDFLTQYFNEQRGVNRDLLERTKRQEEINNLILKNQETIKKIEPGLSNEQKEEIMDFLSQYFNEQVQLIQSLVEQKNVKENLNELKYFSLGDHIEVIYGNFIMNGVFIDIRKDVLVWIDDTMNLHLSNIKGVGIRKKF